MEDDVGLYIYDCDGLYLSNKLIFNKLRNCSSQSFMNRERLEPSNQNGSNFSILNVHLNNDL